jgi:glycogen operon protein
MSYGLAHHTQKALEKGTHFPLGATLTREGVNFAVYSQHAAEVFLLLFDA